MTDRKQDQPGTQKHEKRSARGRALILTGIAFLVITIALIFMAPMLFGIELGGAAIGVLIGVAVSGAIALVNRGRREAAPRAAELLRKDKRPPIVYLRPFADDGVAWKVSFLHSRRKVMLRHGFFPTYNRGWRGH